MGRLIDSSSINNFVMMFKSDWGIFATDIGNAIDSIVMECPTVEAIPKDQYEARLKADMVAMLTEIQLEIEELKNEPACCQHFVRGVRRSSEVIQQKIDKLKENNEVN